MRGGYLSRKFGAKLREVVNISENSWIFHRGKVVGSGKSFLILNSACFVMNSDCFLANLSNLYNLENSSQKPLPDRAFSVHETFPRKSTFPRNLSQTEIFLPRKAFPGRELFQETFLGRDCSGYLFMPEISAREPFLGKDFPVCIYKIKKKV